MNLTSVKNLSSNNLTKLYNHPIRLEVFLGTLMISKRPLLLLEINNLRETSGNLNYVLSFRSIRMESGSSWTAKAITRHQRGKDYQEAFICSNERTLHLKFTQEEATQQANKETPTIPNYGQQGKTFQYQSITNKLLGMEKN